MNRIASLLLTLTVLIPAALMAQVDRSAAPAPGPAPEIILGDYSVETLENGLTLIVVENHNCLLYTSPSPRDRQKSRMPSSA